MVRLFQTVETEGQMPWGRGAACAFEELQGYWGECPGQGGEGGDGEDQARACRFQEELVV